MSQLEETVKYSIMNCISKRYVLLIALGFSISYIMRIRKHYAVKLTRDANQNQQYSTVVA
jgi:hypothetical protein